MTLDENKLFEYAYDELPEAEKLEIENQIAQDPAALKKVNEYLVLKHELKSIPVDSLETADIANTSKPNFLDSIVNSLKGYVVYDLKPNIAFATFAVLLGIGVFQFANQNANSNIENVFFNPDFITELNNNFDTIKNNGEQFYKTSYGQNYSLKIIEKNKDELESAFEPLSNKTIKDSDSFQKYKINCQIIALKQDKEEMQFQFCKGKEGQSQIIFNSK
ncbi:hypothetical protein OAJ21_02050 [Pelagibacteraceae bacterium]|nr:hypothetical protein [Pelagibacteraceae bacterium]